MRPCSAQASASILIVEDDASLAQMISGFLRENGFRTSIEARGDRAQERILKEAPELVLLDVMLPGMDGLAVCRAVRPFYAGAILMLTALADDIDEVAGLEVGADDYLSKPVRPRVLLARVRALLRRQEEGRLMGAAAAGGSRDVIELAGVRIDKGSREAWCGGELLELSTSEFDLLWLLMSHAGQVFSREDLYKLLFNLEFDGIDRSVDLRVSRIRKRLGDDSREPKIIKTVRNAGYLFVAKP